jgi:hypothetical protein
MDDRLSRVEAQIHDLERSLADLERRLGVLELAPHLATPLAPARIESVFAPDLHATHVKVGAAITLLGRTFVALGGAYLLRALTDSSVLPQPIGVALGILYALVWIAAADRDGGRERHLSAAFHALVGILIAFPLVWEATVRFRLLAPGGGALALTGVTVAATGVAVRRRLQPIAWIVLGGAIPTAVAFISATGALATFALYLIGLGVVTLWLGYSCDWLWLRWPAALVADVTVLALTASGASRNPLSTPGTIIAVQMLLLNGYLASIVVRTIFRARDVIPFEVVQSLAALGVGFGGAVYIAGHTGAGAGLLATINLVFGIGCYAVGVAFMRQGRPRNFRFYSALAIVLVIASTSLLLPPGPLALVATALAVLAAWAATRSSKSVLTIHAIAYLVVAGAASGTFAATVRALVGPADGPWTAFGSPSSAVVLGCAMCWLVAPPVENRRVSAASLRVALALLSTFAASGWVVAFAGSILRQYAATPIAPGAIATIRTATLALAAVAMAWAGQRERFREARWLFYPVLAAIGMKLLVEDLPRSKPETLFVALAVYGLALIAVSRLSHRTHPG